MKFYKFIYMVAMYIFIFALAIVSAGFTTYFYTAGADGEIAVVLIGALAITTEGVKFFLALTYPMVRARPSGKLIGRILNTSLVLSILASLNFFSSLKYSPASGTVNTIYAVFGLSMFKSQVTWLLNIALAVLVEVIVVHGPQCARAFKDDEVPASTSIFSRALDLIKTKIPSAPTLEKRAVEDDSQPVDGGSIIKDKPIVATCQIEPRAEITIPRETLELEDFKGQITSPEMLLKAFKAVAIGDLVPYSTKELIERLGITEGDLRKFKKILKDNGAYEIQGGNKICLL